MAKQYNLTPPKWQNESHESRLQMCAETYGMANLRAMRDYDDNEKRKRDAEAKAKLNKGKRR